MLHCMSRGKEFGMSQKARRSVAMLSVAGALSTLLAGCGSVIPERRCTTQAGTGDISITAQQYNPAESRRAYEQASTMTASAESISPASSVSDNTEAITAADKRVNEIMVYPVTLQAQEYLDYQVATLAVGVILYNNTNGETQKDVIVKLIPPGSMTSAICSPEIRAQAENGVAAANSLHGAEQLPSEEQARLRETTSETIAKFEREAEKLKGKFETERYSPNPNLDVN